MWTVGQRRAVTDAVHTLASRYGRNRFLVTSRVAGYQEAALDRRDWQHGTVLPLTDDDIRLFVQKWYAARETDPALRERATDDLIAILEREAHIRDLARNPLLLTIIALVHRVEADLPHERAQLYEKCVRALIETWDSAKNLSLADKQRPFYKMRRRLLERLAFWLHEHSDEPGKLQAIRWGDLKLRLAHFMQAMPRLGLTDDWDAASEEADALIRLVRGRTGLLIESGDRLFTFPHLTFQEYLAACDIKNRSIAGGTDRIWQEIQPRLHDAHWREPILLLIGQLADYDGVPDDLIEKILEAGELDKFEPVLHRHLYFAARVLADRVGVSTTLERRIIDDLFTIIHNQPNWEHGGAFARLGALEENTYTAGLLLKLAQDRCISASTRRDTAQALSSLSQVDEQVIDGLLELAEDSRVNDEVRREAAQALDSLGRVDERFIDRLLKLIGDKQVDNEVCRNAARVLGSLDHLDEQVIENLIVLAQTRQINEWVRYSIIEALRRLGYTNKAARLLLELAQDEQVSEGIRNLAVQALGGIGYVNQQILEGLLRLGHDKQLHDYIRRDAARSLGELGEVYEGARLLLTLAQDERVRDDARGSAAHLLGQINDVDDQIIIGLLELAQNRQVSEDIRYDLVYSLGQLESTDKRVVEGLLEIARDKQTDGYVRCNAAQSLGKLGSVYEAARLLLHLAQDEQGNDSTRRIAIHELGQLGYVEEQVIKGLLKLAQDDQVNDSVRCITAQVLGELGHADKASQLLLKLAQNDQADDDMRCTAAQGLGQLGQAGERIVEGLLGLAQDGQVNDGVRSKAAHALGQLGHVDEAAGLLLGLAQDGKVNDGVRSEAAHALEKLLASG